MAVRYTVPQRICGAARPGFSLIELVTVAVIIVLLIGMVTPSLETARARSKNAVCHARLRQIGIASGIYREGCPSGFGIPVHPLQFCQCGECNTPCDRPLFVGAYEWGGKSGIGHPSLPSDPLTSKYGTRSGFGPHTRPMNNILYPGGFRGSYQSDRILAMKQTQLDLPAYRCPADDGPPGGAHCADWVQNPERSSYDHFGNSYAANTFMIANTGGGEMRSNSPYLRPLSRVPNPARTINFEENIGRWAWACRRENDECIWVGPGVDPGPTKAVRGWHGKNWTFNQLYADGHTDVARVWNEGMEDSEGYATHYRIEMVYPDDPALQQSNRCIIVRGDGWQKDTLPDEPIPTMLYFSGSGRPSYEGCVE